MSRLENRADRNANIIADNANRVAHVAERLSNMTFVAAGGFSAVELYKKRGLVNKTSLTLFAAGVVLKATSGALDLVVDRVNATNGLS